MIIDLLPRVTVSTASVASHDGVFITIIWGPLSIAWTVAWRHA